MTNAEKYLKDGANIDEFTLKFDDWHLTHSNVVSYGEALFRFLQVEVKPTLTEDERVILRNIDKKYSIIYRDSLGRLEVKSVEIESTIWKISMVGFNHLFQFIKERRRI